MDEFGYYKHGDLSPEALAAMRRAMDSGVRQINDFTVSFVSRQRPLGSGTLVRAGDRHAILTAFHVAKVLQERDEPVGVIVSDRDHQLFIEPLGFDFISVGEPANRKHPELGPDLAVLRILDLPRLAILTSKKSFYRLDGRSFNEWKNRPIEQMPWWIAGAPAELARSIGEIDTAKHILAATHFHAEATLVAMEERQGFDFAELQVTAGSHSFPSDYGGVSGGGIWLAPLQMDPDIGPTSITPASPLLAGVAFYQGALQNGHRAIIGHGPQSVYERAATALGS